ncbi:MAG: MalY/PatB family protein, partial [Pseudomonadales bacterium]
TDGLRDGIIKWNGERHGLDLDPRELVISDGVYPGMIAALRTLVPRNNKALIMSPAYSGFYSMVKAARIDSVDSPMTLKNGRFEIDWADLERKMTPDVRVLILCNPQNPTGNVWREEELLRLGRLALEHKIVVLSDEIHGDFVRKGHRYVPFATLKDQAVVENSITCNAISKTFNLAGMKNAYFYSKSPVLLERVKQYHRAELSTLGVVANEAAYAEGQDWFNQARDYIDGTHDLVEKTVKAKMPQVGYVRNEGTFMTFLNFGKVIDAIDPGELAQYGGKTREENFQDWLTYKAGVYVNAGSVYGEGSDGYMRMNVASARSVVSAALDAIAGAIKGL